MEYSYKFIEHTADIALEVTADSYEGLFSAAFEGWKEAAIETAEPENEENKIIEFSENSPEELLVNFLSEINYLLLSKKRLTERLENIQIIKEKEWLLKVNLIGGNLKENHFMLRSEIKAVTFHQMNIIEKAGRLTTRIVFNI